MSQIGRTNKLKNDLYPLSIKPLKGVIIPPFIALTGTQKIQLPDPSFYLLTIYAYKSAVKIDNDVRLVIWASVSLDKWRASSAAHHPTAMH